MSDRDHAAQITTYLQRMQQGDPLAASQVLPLLYEELRGIAGKLLRPGQPHTLQATALVHEAWLKIARAGSNAEFVDRHHFLAVAAKAMRQVLLNHARDRRAQKRGGGLQHLPLDECLDLIEAEAGDLIALHDLLEQLAAHSPRPAQVVELRIFAGLNQDEAAAVLGITPAEVQLDWRFARAFLQRHLGGGSAR